MAMMHPRPEAEGGSFSELLPQPGPFSYTDTLTYYTNYAII